MASGCRYTELLPKNASVFGTEPRIPWPHPRSGHRLLATQHDLWLIGGFHPDGNSAGGGRLFEEVWQFNIASEQWCLLRTTGRMPAELASHAALMDSPYLLVHGGTAIPFGEKRSRKMYMLNLKTLSWSELPCRLAEEDLSNRPKKVYGHSLTLASDRRVVYQIGGTTGFEYSNLVHELDMRSWLWRLVPARLADRSTEAPSERYRHEVLQWRQLLIIVGGGTAVTVCDLERLPAFDTRSETWRWLTTRPDSIKDCVPRPRRCHCCLQQGSWAMLSGGCGADNEPMADVWFLHLPTLTWHYSHELPRPMFFHAGAVAGGGQAFLFGGVTKEGGEIRRSSRLYRCSFPDPLRLEQLCLRVVMPRLMRWLRSHRLTAKALHKMLLQLGLVPRLVTDHLPSDYLRWQQPSPPA